MPFVPLPNTAEVALRFSQDGQFVANVWHVRYEAVPTQALMQTIANNTIFTWQGSLRPIVSNDVTLLEVSVVDQSVQNGVASLLAPTTNNTGQNLSPMMPNGTTVAVKRATGQTGRSFRGRIYHIGLTEEQVLRNNVTPSIVTALTAAYNDFIDAYESIKCEWVVASRVANGAPRPIGVTTPVTGCSTNPTIDSQRRRLPGRGR